MSAIGPKQTWAVALHMSAFEGKADIIAGRGGAKKPRRRATTAMSLVDEMEWDIGLSAPQFGSCAMGGRPHHGAESGCVL